MIERVVGDLHERAARIAYEHWGTEMTTMVVRDVDWLVAEKELAAYGLAQTTAH